MGWIFLYDDDCTGRFRRTTQTDLNFTKYIIEQEVEKKHFIFPLKKYKKWIPLQMTTESSDRIIDIECPGEDMRDKLYIQVVEGYKPILREKRLKKLLD